MTQLNILPSITWRHLESNSVDVKLDNDVSKQYSQKGDDLSEKISTQFGNIKYGLSNEVLDLNYKNRNYQKRYEFLSDENLEIKFDLSKEYDTLNDIHDIIVKDGASSTLLLDYKSEKDVVAYKNTVVKIKAEKNSKLKIVLIQRLSKLSKSFLSIVSDIAESASVEFVHIEIGSDKAYSNFFLNLGEKNANCDIKTAYFVDERRYLDLGYVITHIAEETTSDMVVNGVLKDFAEKRFAGTLDFKKGCTLSSGNEEEFVTLLDPTVKNRAVPILLAREHDIVGNHAASAGRVDKDMLFYITTRGFDELAAKRIIIESKIKPVLDLIGNEEIANEVLEEIREGIN